jgi:hypothetical protein
MKSKFLRKIIDKSKNIFKQKEQQPEDDFSGEDEDLIVIGKHKGVGSSKTQLQSISELAGKYILQEDKYMQEYQKQEASFKGEYSTILKSLRQPLPQTNQANSVSYAFDEIKKNNKNYFSDRKFKDLDKQLAKP